MVSPAHPDDHGTRTAPGTERPFIPKESVVLMVSNEAWDGPRYSKHRYAIALSELRKVYFVDPAPPWRPVHLFMSRITERTTEEGIHVLSYRNPFPVLGGKLSGVIDRIVARRLREHLRVKGEDRPLFWTFDPSRLADPRPLKAIMSVYHCADNFDFKWRGERLLAKTCDHVFCVATGLMPRFRDLNSSVHHFTHGLSRSDMEPSVGFSVEHDRPQGLFIGNINDRHDFVMWEKLFKANPDVDWKIIGPVDVKDGIGLRLINNAPSNVSFEPAVPYAQLVDLIARSDLGFLYMKRDAPGNRLSSQKILQFLALGKPVFCSWFSEYEDRPDLVMMTDDHDAALQQFAHWRQNGEPSAAKDHRLSFAREQLYENILAKLPFRF